MPTLAFLTLPAAGYIKPTLAVVGELAGWGARVFYFCPEDMRGHVEEAGALWLNRPRRAGAAGPATSKLGDEGIRRLPFLMAAAAPVTVPLLVEALEARRPDLVVCNELDLTARLAARAARRPAATFRPFHAAHQRPSGASPPPSEDLAARAALGLADWAARYALPPTSLEAAMQGEQLLRLAFLPRGFQVAAEAFDRRYRFVGPALRPPSPFAWPFPPRTRPRPLRAYVSLGTLRNDRPDFYRLCFDAFSGPEWEVIMSVGERVDRVALGATPVNFHVRAAVPQLAVLAEVDVFVTHGGLNSVMEALWTGVAVVVLPEIGEQRLTASRVAELGLGLFLERNGLTADALRAAARRCADDTAVRSRVDAMRREVREAGGAPVAAQALLQLVQQDRA